MRFVSKNLRKTAHLAFLTYLFFSFSGCSNLESNSTSSKSSVKFQFSASRSAIKIADDEPVFIDVVLQDDKGFEKTDSKEIQDDAVLTFTFNDIPVGKQIEASAKVYTLYENEKLYLYSGTSNPITVKPEENLIELTLGMKYNTLVESPSAFLVVRPLFSLERTNGQLSTNKLNFVNKAGEEEDNESFAYKYNQLSNFQKARVTFRGASLSEDAVSRLRFRLVKSTTGARYPLDTKTVAVSPSTYEFEIPQLINLNTIAVENEWDVSNEDWAPDFSCYIEKIELLQDDSLVDPDFNKITKTDTTCTILNPPVQNFVSTKINKNEITFDSTQGKYDTGSGYSAAYWEYEDLDDYDKITIKVKASNPNNFDQIKIVVKGFSPFNYPSKTECQTGTDNQVTFEAADTSQTFTFYRTELATGLNGETATGAQGSSNTGDPIPLTAILFQNDSYEGNWVGDSDAELDYGDPWQLEIEEIVLEKVGQFNINISVPSSNSDINVVVKVDGETITQTSDSPITVPSDKEIQFVADDNYTSYVWKINGEEQTSATGNTFTLDSSVLLSGNNDITLLADNDDMNLHHSWTAQVTKN